MTQLVQIPLLLPTNPNSKSQHQTVRERTENPLNWSQEFCAPGPIPPLMRRRVQDVSQINHLTSQVLALKFHHYDMRSAFPTLHAIAMKKTDGHFIFRTLCVSPLGTGSYRMIRNVLSPNPVQDDVTGGQCTTCCTKHF